jgi:peptidoglycan/xylan/chitin deacetylase (PgdA/CDA1 family)
MALALLGARPVMAADSAVVLAYHRFDDDRVPALNTTSDQLAAHLEAIRLGGHKVLALPDIVKALKDGTPLPDKALAFTLDDGAASQLAVALPMLKRAGFPVTLAVATDEIDRGGADVIGWAQLRELAAQGVTIASQGAARLRMAKASPDIIAADLSRSNARFLQELGKTPTLFMWPGGEASLAAMEEVRKAGFIAAFGQHSGAAWAKADPYYLPRFAAAGSYGDAERVRVAMRAVALPAIDITPADPVVRVNPPAFGFTLAEEVAGIDGLACFSSHQGQVRIERLGPRVEVRMAKPMAPGRVRLNCTVTTLEGRWRWFGWQFVVP